MRKIYLLLMIFLAFAAFTACDFSSDKGDGAQGNTDKEETSVSDVFFDVGEEIFLVTNGRSDLLDLGIDELTCQSFSDFTISYLSEEMPKMEREITVGVCDREVSTVGYRKLSALPRESDETVRYGVYSADGSVAIVYDKVLGLEKEIISCAFSLFCRLYVKENSPISIEDGEFISSTVSISALQERKNAAAWENFESVAGKESAKILKKMYSELYTDEIIDFIGSLYDNNYGGFYYSPTARDTLSFKINGSYQYVIPDASSTLMALSFIEKSGMACGYLSAKDALPVWMRYQINRFLAANEEEEKDEELSDSVIAQLNASCNPENGLWTDGLNLSDPYGLYELLEIYSIYERFGAAIPYPEKAMDSLISTLKNADDPQPEQSFVVSLESGILYAWNAVYSITKNLEMHNPDAFTEVKKTLVENGAEIIGAAEKYVRECLCADGSFASSAKSEEGNILSTVYLSTEIMECIFASFGSPMVDMFTRSDLERFVERASQNRIFYNYAPSEDFCQSGAVNYKTYTYKNADGNEEAMIFIYNTEEFSGEKLQRGIINYIITSDDGIRVGLSLDRLDYLRALNFDGRFAYHYAASESDVKDGCVNYKVTPYSNKAAVLRIYNSYLIKNEDDMREILTRLILSEEGAKAKLSLADIDYYVVEWQAHNVMYENPSIIPFMDENEVMKRAMHVDLNVDDSYASIYYSIVSTYM